MNSRMFPSNFISARKPEGKSEKGEESLMDDLWQQTSSWTAFGQSASLQGDNTVAFTSSSVVVLHPFPLSSPEARITLVCPLQSEELYFPACFPGVWGKWASGEEELTSQLLGLQPRVWPYRWVFVSSKAVRDFLTPSILSCSIWKPHDLTTCLFGYRGLFRKQTFCLQQSIAKIELGAYGCCSSGLFRLRLQAGMNMWS